jgi:Flp pilus assembly protein TadG
MIRGLARLARNERGAAVIELALVAPILATLVIGITDVSIAYGHKLELEQAAQRAIEKVGQTTGDKTPEATIQKEAVCQINGANEDGTCKEGRITTDNVTVKGNVTLAAGGTYVINSTKNGGLTMNSTTASLACAGCTIILTNFTDPTKTGGIKLTGGTLTLEGMKDGNYKGMALIQDPKATDSGQKTQNQINGNNGASVQGIVYIPNQSLLYNGGGKVNAACLQVVGKRLEFSGSSKIKVSNQCAAYGIDPIGSGDSGRRVRLVA